MEQGWTKTAGKGGGRAIGWGVLGAGNIANRFCNALAHESRARLVAISGRDKAHVSAFAEAHHPDKVYLDHQALIDDPDVDAIYLALPHGLHAQWAMRALEAGKAVLCEKPACLSADELAGVLDCAHRHGSLFVEAMKTRFVPAYGRMTDLLRDGSLGAITSVRASICHRFPDDIGGYFVDPAQGGCLYDTGVYGVSWLDALTHGRPVLVKASADRRGAVDWYDDAFLLMGDVPCELECASDRAMGVTLSVHCERGSVEIPQFHRPTELIVKTLDGSGETLVSRHLEAPYVVDDFFGEISHFDDCLTQGLMESPVMPHAASLRCAEVIDLIRTATSTGKATDPRRS